MLLQWGNKHLAKVLLSGHASVATNKQMETALFHLSDVAHVLYSSKHKNKPEGNRLR